MMTKQEAVWYANHVFNLVIERCFNAQNLKDAREFDEAKQIVIEALEQEPSNEYDYSKSVWENIQEGNGISKDIPEEPKRGKWILGKREWGDNYLFTCSECSHDIVTSKTRKIPYCWFCGARMENDGE